MEGPAYSLMMVLHLQLEDISLPLDKVVVSDVKQPASSHNSSRSTECATLRKSDLLIMYFFQSGPVTTHI